MFFMLFLYSVGETPANRLKNLLKDAWSVKPRASVIFWMSFFEQESIFLAST